MIIWHSLPQLLLLWLLGIASVEAEPLEGRLWSPQQQRFVPWQEFYSHWLPDGGWLIIGESHDNPDHHRIETDLIEALAQRQQLGAVALEMAHREQQPALDLARATPEQITPQQLDWSEGWSWTLYEAPVRAALRHASRVLGADLTPLEIRRAYREGAPEGELEPAHSAFMRDLMHSSHCGQLPDTQLDPMRQVQLARDQQIAQVLNRHRQPGKTGILLTGTIHARLDLGVPRWLGTTPVRSLLLQSLDARTAAQAYVPDSFGNLPRSDLILFTPAIDAPDYCARLNP